MQNETGTGNGLFQIIKGSALALGISLLFAVAFATLLTATPIPDAVTYPVNQTVKGLCIALGTLAFVRGEKGFLKGGGIALIFTSLSYLAFSALGGNFSLSWLILVELFIALLIGVLSGAVAVNMQRV